MTATRRILAAVALASSVTGLTVTAASAMEVPSVLGQLDALSAQSVTPEHAHQMPTVTGQLGTVAQGASQLNQLRQVTDLAAPVTGLLPAVEY